MDFEVITEHIVDILKVSVSLFIIVDSIGNIPIFLSLTESVKRRRGVIFRQAIVVSFILLMFFSILGEGVLRFFNISIYSFAIAGGVLLIFISIRMLIGELSEVYDKEKKEFLGVVPLAFPLLVGPGAITTSMLSIQQFGILPTVVSVILVSALNWFILMNSERLNNLLGKTGSIIVSKLMAIFISAIAVEYIVFGVKNAFYR
ncbi:MAG: MarC family protein [Candidatus Calescibacterium sp.]|nr:MarC family protein [Candidatus Calescibacterium sp.]MCX7734343.1 MarC family protein [bacterium]MDW8087614.1 MarC family protein [Candidatus Calescibacterium sp.]